jgi:hypothetical protein
MDLDLFDVQASLCDSIRELIVRFTSGELPAEIFKDALEPATKICQRDGVRYFPSTFIVTATRARHILKAGLCFSMLYESKIIEVDTEQTQALAWAINERCGFDSLTSDGILTGFTLLKPRLLIPQYVRQPKRMNRK